jgi:hypothetical protein
MHFTILSLILILNKFDFLDSREGSVSAHYRQHYKNKTLKKRRKKYEDSEQNDTVHELPPLDIQTNKCKNLDYFTLFLSFLSYLNTLIFDNDMGLLIGKL